jgi:hypothetical protein
MSLFPIFIKSSSNLLALIFFSVYLEDVKEKNQIPLYLKIKVPIMKSPLNLVKSLLAVAGVAALSTISAAPSSAFNFSNISDEDTVGDAYTNSFGVTLTSEADLVFLNISNFGNTLAPEMFIAGVFIEDNEGYLSNPWFSLDQSVGNVVFNPGSSDAQLPQGGKSFTTKYSFFSANGDGNGYGVQADEKLVLAFTGSTNNVLAALESGEVKIGLHVQALPSGASDSYISSNSGNTENTPEPLTMLAAGAAVGFGTMFKKQRDRAQKAE